MSRLRALPLYAAIHIRALLVACVGFVLLVFAGAPEIPPIPPGPVVLLAVAVATVTWPSHRWPPLVGALICVVILFGEFVIYSGTIERLADPGSVGLFLGTVAALGGVTVAAISGAAAALTPRRRAALIH